VQARRERELVALEQQRRRSTDERRQHGGACLIDLDRLDARLAELGLPARQIRQRDRRPDVELTAGDQGLTNRVRKSLTCGFAIDAATSRRQLLAIGRLG